MQKQSFPAQPSKKPVTEYQFFGIFGQRAKYPINSGEFT